MNSRDFARLMKSWECTEELKEEVVFSSWLDTGHFVREKAFDRNALILRTRSSCFNHEPSDPYWAGEGQDWTEQQVLDIMAWGLEGADEHEAALHRAHRHTVLRDLVKKKKRLDQRRELGLEYVVNHVDYFCGWPRLIARTEFYQLGDEFPWYKEVALGTLLRDVREWSNEPEQLEARGYVRVSQEVYRAQAQRAIMLEVLKTLTAPIDELSWLAHVLVLFTSKVKRWGQDGYDPGTLVASELSILTEALQEQIGSVQYTRVPMRLYQLPRHARVLSSVYVSCHKRELFDPLPHNSWSAWSKDTGVRFVESTADTEQLALFYDTDLIRSKQSTYMSIELENIEDDPIGSLVRAIERYPISNASSFEHLPRVLTGMFAAANRDGLGGMFWDTKSGRRLCTLIGFDPENKRHRKRVQDARMILEAFTLHRQFQQRTSNGDTQMLKMSGPLIYSRPNKTLELTLDQREGMSQHHEFMAWSIDEHLWKATLNASAGGTPAFMLIDKRAFGLDSSLAFNLYWTLINRAYVSSQKSPTQGVDARGEFATRLGVLYDWSGVDSPALRMGRMRNAFREAFKAMTDLGLLLGWESQVLDPSAKGIDFETFASSQLTVRLPDSITKLIVSTQSASDKISQTGSAFDAARALPS